MIRIATIGTSPITDNFIEVLAANPRATFVGAQSRNAERAAAFTADHGGTTPFTSVEELAQSDAVDAVYVGSPNALHAEQALTLIAGGKHVLVEKTFATNRAEAERVFAAAEQANVVALEAMRPLHDPAYYEFKKAVAGIGRVRRASIHFGKYSSRYDDILAGRHTNIFDCKMASGGLMDMGVYSVEPLIDLMGEPERVQYAPILLDEDTRELTNGPIDAAGIVTCIYPDAVGTANYSKFTQDFCATQIEGEHGTVTLDSISMPSHMRINMLGKAVRMAAKHGSTPPSASIEEVELPHCDNSMCYELDDFVRAIEHVQAGTPALEAPCGEHGTVERFRALTLATLSVMDEARAQGGIVFPADEQ